MAGNRLKSFKEAKRNVNERSKRNMLKLPTREELCIVFKARAAAGIRNRARIADGFPVSRTAHDIAP